jgi:hypothetical protein
MKRLTSPRRGGIRCPSKSERAVNAAESQLRILAEDGKLIEQRIRTEPERFAAVLGARPRIVIEASTDSECEAIFEKSLDVGGSSDELCVPIARPLRPPCKRHRRSPSRNSRR